LLRHTEYHPMSFGPTCNVLVLYMTWFGTLPMFGFAAILDIDNQCVSINSVTSTATTQRLTCNDSHARSPRAWPSWARDCIAYPPGSEQRGPHLHTHVHTVSRARSRRMDGEKGRTIILQLDLDELIRLDRLSRRSDRVQGDDKDLGLLRLEQGNGGAADAT
jgi:hypothetical protein